MGGLRAFCLQKRHSRKKNGNYGRRRVFKTKLIDELEEMSINGRTLSVKLRDGAEEVNSVLDSKIGNTSNVWRDELLQYLEEIDKLIID